MTKPIIINGVDVSECIYIDENTIPQDCGVNCSFCYEFKNCYYKQLKRKEQELKELKNKLEKAENNCIKVFNLFSKLGEKYKELKLESENQLNRIENILSVENIAEIVKSVLQKDELIKENKNGK